MKSKNQKLVLAICAIALVFSSVALGQDSVSLSVAPSVLHAIETGGVIEGQKLKIEGVVINRNEQSFTVRDAKGRETVVVVTGKTEITKERKGWFRADKRSNTTEICRGLRVKVEGKGNSEGELTAKRITFDEQDLNTAEALAARVDPVEKQASSTQALAENNQTRIGEAEKRLDQTEQNAQRLSGQVDELSTVANAAVSAAKVAQSAADQAETDATTANDRIGALDDYQPLVNFAVYFKTGSARLTASAKQALDEAAGALSSNLKGWVVAVEGYADSEGGEKLNRSLSQRRAEAVIDYLVTKHGLPPRRVVQPFGYGSLYPVASNHTKDGRSANRRAQVTVLINKGIMAASTRERTTQSSSSNQQ